MEKQAFIITHVAHEGPGIIAESLRAAGIGYQVVNAVDLSNGSRGLDSAAGLPDYLIVMGGPASVCDGYPGMETEITYIRRAADAGIPVLGVCLGSQLIAAALGARVFPCGGKEIGWYEIELTPAGLNDPVLGMLARGAGESGIRDRAKVEDGRSFQPHATVFQWHGDTFDIPEGAERLASSPLCPNQAFRFGRRVYGLQFHLEVDAAMAATWLQVDDNIAEIVTAFGPERLGEIRSGIALHAAAVVAAGSRAFEAFLALQL